MKDSYSFDVDDEAFTRVVRTRTARPTSGSSTGSGFDYVIVSAMSGAMGGSASEEFLATAENGEDTYVRCTNCDYAANVEAVRVPVPDRHAVRRRAGRARRGHTGHADHRDAGRAPATRRFARDDRDVDRRGHAEERGGRRCAHPDGTREPLAIGVPGDREVDAQAARRRRSSRPRSQAFTEEDFAPAPGAGARATSGRRRWARRAPPASATCSTRASSTGTRWVTGANEPTAGTSSTWWPAATSPATAPSRRPRCAPATRARDCGGTLVIARGIEIGHIFQLGRKYADALDLQVLDENGKLVTVTMGSYGIGVSRAVAAIAENDARRARPVLAARDRAGRRARRGDRQGRRGLRRRRRSWPTISSTAGLEVLYDDRRGVSPGVKFKDAELIGVPTIVVVGKGLADGMVEVRDRRTGEREGRRRRGCGCPDRARVAPWRRRRGHLRLGRHADAVAHDRPARAVGAYTRVVRPGPGRRAGADAARGRERGLARGSRAPALTARSTTSSGRSGIEPSGPAPRDGAAPPTTRSGRRTRTSTRTRRRCWRRCARAASRSACCRTRSGRATYHEEVFRRDGVLDLIDGAVYSSEIPWTKPHPEAFRAAMAAVGVDDPAQVRLRRRPAVRRRPRRQGGRHARGARAAQRDPGRPAGPHRGRAGRGRAAARRPARGRRRLARRGRSRARGAPRRGDCCASARADRPAPAGVAALAGGWPGPAEAPGAARWGNPARVARHRGPPLPDPRPGPGCGRGRSWSWRLARGGRAVEAPRRPQRAWSAVRGRSSPRPRTAQVPRPRPATLVARTPRRGGSRAQSRAVPRRRRHAPAAVARTPPPTERARRRDSRSSAARWSRRRRWAAIAFSARSRSPAAQPRADDAVAVDRRVLAGERGLQGCRPRGSRGLSSGASEQGGVGGLARADRRDQPGQRRRGGRRAGSPAVRRRRARRAPAGCAPAPARPAPRAARPRAVTRSRGGRAATNRRSRRGRAGAGVARRPHERGRWAECSAASGSASAAETDARARRGVEGDEAPHVGADLLAHRVVGVGTGGRAPRAAGARGEHGRRRPREDRAPGRAGVGHRWAVLSSPCWGGPAGHDRTAAHPLGRRAPFASPQQQTGEVPAVSTSLEPGRPPSAAGAGRRRARPRPRGRRCHARRQAPHPARRRRRDGGVTLDAVADGQHGRVARRSTTPT